MGNHPSVLLSFQEKELLKAIATDAQEEVLILKEAVIQGHHIVNVISAALVSLFLCLIILLWKNFARNRRFSVILDKKLRERNRQYNLQQEQQGRDLA
ncbi:MAG TPA: hypothetical protein VGD40_03260 [Chryseosolibacter sp.]